MDNTANHIETKKCDRSGIGGPRTPEGKLRSRQNAVTHGCSAHTIQFLPDEDPREYDEIAAHWLEKLHPLDQAEHELVIRVAKSAWRARRAEHNLEKVEAARQQPPAAAKAVENNSSDANPSTSAIDWTDEHHRQYERFQRYYTAELNRFHKALQTFWQLRKSCQGERKNLKQDVAAACDDFTSSQALQTLKDHAEDAILESLEVPLERTDGGCTCPPCSWAYGIEKRQQREANKRNERSQIPPNQAQSRKQDSLKP